MTTKSGSDEFHGLASDYFTRQGMYAKYSVPNAAQTYAPFHGNNISATIGGPIIPHHQFFFFFGIEALRSAVSTGNQVLTFADPAFASWAQANNTWERAFQVNWTPTFSPTLLNEVVFAQNRIEGKLNETGDFTIPTVGVTGQNLGYGLGFAQGDFIQHNYHWRDVLTNVRGAHVLKVGYDGWFGDDVEPFQGPWSHPSFNFDNLLKLAQDAPSQEQGVMYSPVTGQQQLWDWNAASKTWGLFAEDTWKARRNLTLTLGFRFDDQGNPYSRSASTVLDRKSTRLNS